LYLKTNTPVIINGNVEPAILILGAIKPIKKSNNIIVLKQANPIRLKILLVFCWKMVYNIIICPHKGIKINGCKNYTKLFFAFKNISASL
jgi:hypothetical protein